MLTPEQELRQAQEALERATRANGGIGFDGTPTHDRLRAEARLDLARARLVAARDPLVHQMEKVRVALARRPRRRDPLVEALAHGFLILAEQATENVTRPLAETRAHLERLDDADARRRARLEQNRRGMRGVPMLPLRARLTLRRLNQFPATPRC